MSFFGNPVLYYADPGYSEEGYAFNPDFAAGNYSGATSTTTAAQWAAVGGAFAFYEGSAAAATTATWQISGVIPYAGTSLATIAATWSGAGGGIGLYVGSQGDSASGAWAAQGVADPRGPIERQPLPPRITRRGFGGSDRVAPDLNAQQYVRFNTVRQPRDLGALDQQSIVVNDFIGAKAGSQSLFFQFRTSRPAAIGVRVLADNPYIRQYIKTFLFDQQEQQLPSGDISFRPLLPPGRPRIRLTAELVSTGYTDGGYWENGYAEGDGGTTPVVIESIEQDPPRTPLEALPAGSVQPAGSYRVTVTSSNWQKLPFTLQVAVRTSSPLRGEIPLFLTPTGRISLQKIAGSIDLQLDLTATPRTYLRAHGLAELKLAPRATLRRISPF